MVNMAGMEQLNLSRWMAFYRDRQIKFNERKQNDVVTTKAGEILVVGQNTDNPRAVICLDKEEIMTVDNEKNPAAREKDEHQLIGGDHQTVMQGEYATALQE